MGRKMNCEKLTETLRKNIPAPELSHAVGEIIIKAIRAVDPCQCVLNALNLHDNALSIARQSISMGEVDNIYLISIGKAALPMAEAVIKVLNERITDGILVIKHQPDHNINDIPSSFRIIQGGHPVPDQGSLSAGKSIFELLERTKPSDLVIFCISGGGSALVTYPYAGISLADLQELTKQLLACGASIDEINTIRKHLDRVKGGGLARAAYPARFISLVLSDVVGDPLNVIASGPTVPDSTSFRDAEVILRKYQLDEKISSSILSHLQNGAAGEIPDTPKESDPIFEGAITEIVGSNYTAARAALETAIKYGFNAQLLTTFFQGEASHVGRMLGAILRQIDKSGEPLKKPACIIAGGETTVTIKGEGIGGRNLEVALGAAKEIAGLARVAFISLATDGEDGPTDAAGAVASGATLQHAREKGLNPDQSLSNNDTFTFFQELGGLIRTGPTGTNVNDLYFLFAF
jgi:hydroxypyruvate reductase